MIDVDEEAWGRPGFGPARYQPCPKSQQRPGIRGTGGLREGIDSGKSQGLPHTSAARSDRPWNSGNCWSTLAHVQCIAKSIVSSH
jgi:hypothetical protein